MSLQCDQVLMNGTWAGVVRTIFRVGPLKPPTCSSFKLDTCKVNSGVTLEAFWGRCQSNGLNGSLNNYGTEPKSYPTYLAHCSLLPFCIYPLHVSISFIPLSLPNYYSPLLFAHILICISFYYLHLPLSNLLFTEQYHPLSPSSFCSEL